MILREEEREGFQSAPLRRSTGLETYSVYNVVLGLPDWCAVRSNVATP